jgi:hypothetical protein
MIILTSNEQARELVHNGVLAVEDDIEIAFDGFHVDANIRCHNIYSKGYRRNINCGNIICEDINCRDINCRDINCEDINAGDIEAEGINVSEINAGNIKAEAINAWGINAGNISYYDICIVCDSLKCKSISGRGKNARHFCIDGEIEIIPEDTFEVKILKNGKPVDCKLSVETAKRLGIIE